MSENKEDKVYSGELFKIRTDDGYRYVPGLTVNHCDGLAVCMAHFGDFNVTHMATGERVSGDYKQCDNAILDLTRFSLIAATHKFSWSDLNPRENIKKVFDDEVPFSGCTISDEDGVRSMTIGRWISSLRPMIPGNCIDSSLWEDEPAICIASDIVEEIMKIKEI